METLYKINGVQIKRPSSFKIEVYPITTLTRVADGSMQGDIIAWKRKFYFSYDAISSNELNIILDAITFTKNIFYTLSYIDNNETKSAIVYVGSVPRELHRTGGTWVWKTVTFDLIEK